MEDLLSLTAWLTPQYHVNIQIPPSTSLQSFALTLESEFARVYGLNDLRIAALQDRNHHDLPIEKNDMQVGLLLQNEDKVYVVLHPDGNPLQRKGSSPKNSVSSSDTQSYLQAYFKLRLNIRPEEEILSSQPPTTTSRETEIIIQRLADVSKRISRNRGAKSDTEDFSSLLTSMSGQQKELLVKMGRTLTRDMARVLDCSPKGTSSPISDDVATAEPTSPMFFFSKEDSELPRETCKKRKGSSYPFTTSPPHGFSPASPSISPTSSSPASALASAFSQRFFFPNSPASLSSQTSTTISLGPTSPTFDFSAAKKQKKKKSSRAPLRITTAEVEAPPKIVFMKGKSPPHTSPESPSKSPTKKSPTKRGKGKISKNNPKYPKSPQAISPNSSHLDVLVEVAQATQTREKREITLPPLIST